MLLAIESVSKSFGGVAALREATFAVAEGSITALIGPNGAGKSTVFNVASGFLKPDSGTVTFAGRRIERLRGDAVARSGLVRVFQTARVLTRMTVLDNLMLAAPNQPGEWFGAGWVMPGRVRAREGAIRAEAQALLALLRLDRLAGDYAGTLSGGQRKLLELGRAMMSAPRMILLDEPMAGVAPALAEQLLDHIRLLPAARGITVCLIEHDMDLVMSVSDRVIVMDEGHVIAADAPGDVQQNERVIEAYLGRTAARDTDATRYP